VSIFTYDQASGETDRPLRRETSVRKPPGASMGPRRWGRGKSQDVRWTRTVARLLLDRSIHWANRNRGRDRQETVESQKKNLPSAQQDVRANVQNSRTRQTDARLGL